jgi:hypothetical protein
MDRSILLSGGGFVQSHGFQIMEPSSSPAKTPSSQQLPASVTACRYLVYEAYATRQTASAECSAWRPMAWTPSMRFGSTRLAAGGPAYGLRQSSAAGPGQLRSGKPLALSVLGRCGLETV